MSYGTLELKSVNEAWRVISTAGVQMYVCNKDHYGYLPVPLNQDQTLEEEEESFTHTLTEALSKYFF